MRRPRGRSRRSSACRRRRSRSSFQDGIEGWPTAEFSAASGHRPVIPVRELTHASAAPPCPFPHTQAPLRPAPSPTRKRRSALLLPPYASAAPPCSFPHTQAPLRPAPSPACGGRSGWGRAPQARVNWRGNRFAPTPTRPARRSAPGVRMVRAADAARARRTNPQTRCPSFRERRRVPTAAALLKSAPAFAGIADQVRAGTTH